MPSPWRQDGRRILKKGLRVVNEVSQAAGKFFFPLRGFFTQNNNQYI